MGYSDCIALTTLSRTRHTTLPLTAFGEGCPFAIAIAVRQKQLLSFTSSRVKTTICSSSPISTFLTRCCVSTSQTTRMYACTRYPARTMLVLVDSSFPRSSSRHPPLSCQKCLFRKLQTNFDLSNSMNGCTDSAFLSIGMHQSQSHGSPTRCIAPYYQEVSRAWHPHYKRY